MVIGDLGTYAGIPTDGKCPRTRCRRPSDLRPVCAGNDMASIMGGNYPGAGITLGPALTFVHIAAAYQR